MARLGAFDLTLRPAALFDDALVAEGGFSEDLIDAPASGSVNLTPALVGLVLAPAAPGRVAGTLIMPRTP